MAEVAASVLHNVGNVLNSISVSATIVNDKVNKSKLDGLTDLSELLTKHTHDLSTFISQDSKGSQIPDYLKMLSSYWEAEKSVLSNETETLKKNIDHVKSIIAMQQELSKSEGFEQLTSLKEILDESLMIAGLDTNANGIIVEKKYASLHPILVDKVKLLQILVNLLRNAKDSLVHSTNQSKKITLETGTISNEELFVQVSDNGLGILSKNLTKIFGYGFTTKKEGHGFGLHSSAIAANDMGGSLKAKSSGENMGATFTLALPYRVSTSGTKKIKDIKVS